MRVLTCTAAVDPRSHAGQRQVAREREELLGNCSREQRSRHKETVRHEWTRRDVATSRVRGVRAHDAIATLLAIVGDDVTAAVSMINGRGDILSSTPQISVVCWHATSRAASSVRRVHLPWSPSFCSLSSSSFWPSLALPGGASIAATHDLASGP